MWHAGEYIAFSVRMLFSISKARAKTIYNGHMHELYNIHIALTFVATHIPITLIALIPHA